VKHKLLRKMMRFNLIWMISEFSGLQNHLPCAFVTYRGMDGVDVSPLKSPYLEREKIVNNNNN